MFYKCKKIYIIALLIRGNVGNFGNNLTANKLRERSYLSNGRSNNITTFVQILILKCSDISQYFITLLLYIVYILLV